MYHMEGYKSIENPAFGAQIPCHGLRDADGHVHGRHSGAPQFIQWEKTEVAHMGKNRQSADLLADQLDNFDLTRKVIALRSLDLLTKASEAEAAKAQPDLAALADLGIAIATLLSSVG